MHTRLIILITDLEVGGAPLFVRDLAIGLAREGTFAPTVVSLAGIGPVGGMLRGDGVPVRACDARSAADVSALGRWMRIARDVRPEVVLSVLVHANAAASFCAPFLKYNLSMYDHSHGQITYIQSIHTMQSRPRWHWVLQGLVGGACAGVIAPNAAILARLARFGWRGRGVVVPNGIDINRFANAIAVPTEDRPWPASARVVGHVGRFDPVKRLDVLLNEMRLLVECESTVAEFRGRPWHLALLGYGECEKALRTMAHFMGIDSRIHFLGRSSTPQRWYKCMDMLALASVEEGFGLVLVEALAAGVPIVACESAVSRAVLGDGRFGTLVSADQVGSLAAGMQAVALSNDGRGASVQAGVAFARQAYGEASMIARYVAALKNFQNFF